MLFRSDGGSPLYIASRVGRGGELFRMLKLRSMRIDSDKTGVTTTTASDDRVTPIGNVVRRFKLDELMQFANVLKGEMSVVGPRPQVQSAVDDYTPAERGLLDARPGITDFSSIVFADEGDILAGSDDPDGDYDRIIRPWKSRLGLFYNQRRSLPTDLRLIALTALALVSRPRALQGVSALLDRLGADLELVEVARRAGEIPIKALP